MASNQNVDVQDNVQGLASAHTSVSPLQSNKALTEVRTHATATPLNCVSTSLTPTDAIVVDHPDATIYPTEISPLVALQKTANASVEKNSLTKEMAGDMESSPLVGDDSQISPSSTNASSESLSDGAQKQAQSETTPSDDPKKENEPLSCLKVLSCFVLGAGLELPYNAFITALDYFQLTYPGRDVEFVLTLAFDPTGFLGFVIGFFWLSKIFSMDVRVLTSLVLEFLAILLVIILPYIGSEEAGFIVIVALMALVGICTSMLHLAVFGLVAPHGSICCTALMTGVGAAGLITSILRVLTKAIFPNDFQGLADSAVLFFSLAAAWIVGCCICYCYLRPSESHKVTIDHLSTESESLCSAVRRVSKLMGYHHVVVGVCFTITYVAFPGMLSIIHSDNYELNRTNWYAVILVAVYNFCNFISSSVSNRLRMFNALQSGRLLLLSCLRIVFPIVFGLCAFADLQISDAVIYVLVVIFGLSQGYLASLAVILGTELSPKDAQLAGEMMSFGLAIGIMSGTVIAFIISQSLE